MSKDLTQGNIPQQLFQLGWPMTVGIFAIIGFNVVDTFFVAQLGTLELAAMTMTFPVVMFVISLSLGMSVALSSLISRESGAGNRETLKEITTDALSLAFLLVICVSALGLLTIDPLFGLLGAEGKTLELVRDYMTIWYLNIVFLVFPMVGNGAIRGTGDTRFPAMIMVVAGGVNAILDPLLIFGLGPFPRMELEGAALATVLSRVVTLIAAIYVLKVRLGFLTNPFESLARTFQNWKRVASIAVPAAISNAVVPLSAFVVTAMVADYGAVAIAGFGVGTRVESLLTVVLMGASAGLGPFVGQNYGAKRLDRVRESLSLTHKFSFGWGLFSAVLIFAFADPINSVFSDEAEVVKVSSLYLKVVVLSLFFQGILYNVNSAFNALGESKRSLNLTVLRMGVLYIPMALVLRIYFEVDGIFFAALLANTLAGIFGYFYFNGRHKECVAVEAV